MYKKAKIGYNLTYEKRKTMINIYAGLDLVEKLVKDAKRYYNFDQQDKFLGCINKINQTLAEISALNKKDKL